MLCYNGLQDVKKFVVLGEGVWCWGKFSGATDRKLGSGRRVGEKREDMAAEGPIIWEDILVEVSAGDARSTARRTM